jgi:outer membrane lipoprotein carrier protein
MRVILLVLIAVVMSSLFASISVQSKLPFSLPNVLRLLESRYAGASTLRVRFLERYTENGRFVRSEAGSASFLRPGKMRWDYEAPEKNTFLVDGKYVWFYSPADRTATRMPAKQSEDWRTPLAFLTTHMKLSHLCSRIEEEEGQSGVEVGDAVFRCELKGLSRSEPIVADGLRRPSLQLQQSEGPGATRGVLLEVSPEGELRRIVVQEEAGMELEFSFTGWEWDPPLDKSTFQFVVPRGVAIVDGVLSEAPGLRQ